MVEKSCYFCSEFEVLEEHHLVPRRYGGSDRKDNLVTLCPTCHSKVEGLYDDELFGKMMSSGFIRIDVDQDQLTNTNMIRHLEAVEHLVESLVSMESKMYGDSKEYTELEQIKSIVRSLKGRY